MLRRLNLLFEIIVLHLEVLHLRGKVADGIQKNGR